MILLRDSTQIPENCKHAVLAVGNFDGVHLGHQEIVRIAVEAAKARGCKAGVLTFEPHPRRVFKPELPLLRILPFTAKMQKLAALGIDFIRVARFTRAFAEQSAETFIERYLKQQLAVSQLVVGEGFTFGHRRSGTLATLQEHGVDVISCKPVMVNDERSSSTRIREALIKGDMEHAATLLGGPYSITGRVGGGEKRGRQLGFPTANLAMPGLFIPAHGVYAVRMKVDGTWLPGVANLGRRPTFPGSPVLLEVHLLGWQGDLYGKRVEVQLLKHLRDERQFSGLDELKSQIAKDCFAAGQYFR